MKKKSEKVTQAEELKKQLATVSTVILSTFQGITVEQDTKLRRSVEAAGGKFEMQPRTDNPDKIRVFAEEVVRLETPLPFIGRFTTKEVTIAGVTIPAGSVVRLCLASTNLDHSEDSWVTVTDDGKIRPKQHRSFGGGVHRCLGKALARVELTVIVTEWLRAVPGFELERGFTPSFTFTQGGAIMPSSLPLRWGQPRS